MLLRFKFYLLYFKKEIRFPANPIDSDKSYSVSLDLDNDDQLMIQERVETEDVAEAPHIKAITDNTPTNNAPHIKKVTVFSLFLFQNLSCLFHSKF